MDRIKNLKLRQDQQDGQDKKQKLRQDQQDGQDKKLKA
jgi:hypothetical protein